MATERNSKPTNSNKNNKKRKNFLPHNKPVKKGAYPLCAGVEGFFITCAGGREHQAANEAINVIESFYEELLEDAESKVEQAELPNKPLNKITKFVDYDFSGSDNDDDDDDKDSNKDEAKDKHNLETGEDKKKNADQAKLPNKPLNKITKFVDYDSSGSNNDEDDDDKDSNKDEAKDKHNLETGEDKKKNAVATGNDGNDESILETKNRVPLENQMHAEKEKPENQNIKEAEALGPPAKRQCTDADAPKSGGLSRKVEEKSVDKLIEAELAELGDRSKRCFSKLETGCNGVVFIQMRKREGDPCPKDIVQHMMTSLARTKKHVSRFLLRVLPVEVACYTSVDEIRRAIKPVIDKYFPTETEKSCKFSVLYDARANTGIVRTKIIDAVAKCVPSVHKIDLANPDISIMVQIVKTVCLIGIVEKYKEFAKYNLRQLSSSSEQQ